MVHEALCYITYEMFSTLQTQVESGHLYKMRDKDWGACPEVANRELEKGGFN